MITKKSFISLEIGPNFQRDDANIALKSIFGLASAKKIEQTKTLIDTWFEQNYAQKPWYTSTCRAGIYLLLKNLNLPTDSEVLVQGFSCIVVPNAVLQADLEPIVCDVDRNTFNFDLNKIENYITPKTKAWIVQHNFGITIDMDKVLEICQKHKLILIEDCAHSLGGKYFYQNSWYSVGSLGHAASFSFGRDKIISTTTGGATFINPSTPLKDLNLVDFSSWTKSLANQYNGLEVMSKKQVREALLYPILTTWFIKPFYNYFVGKFVALLNRKFRLTGLIYSASEQAGDKIQMPTPTKYSDQLFPLLYNQISKISTFKEHRQKIAQIYSEAFGIKIQQNISYLRFPITIEQLLASQNEVKQNTTEDSNDSKKLYHLILNRLKSQCIYLGIWYTKVFLGSSDQYPNIFTLKKIPNISDLINHQTLNLPTHTNTTTKVAHQIVSEIKAIIGKYS